MSPRVLLLTPTALPSRTGNAVTAERWRRGLVARGFDVRVLAAEGLAPADLRAVLGELRPALVHAHHAVKSGGLLAAERSSGRLWNVPLVVSLAGTDVAPDGLEEARRVLLRADAVVSQGPELARRAAELCTRGGPLLVQVPKACEWLGSEHFPLREEAGWSPGDTVFLLVAGVRPVKGNLECLRALEEVHRQRPSVRAAFAGPVLDEAYAARFRNEVARLGPFVRWFPAVPVEAMRSIYEAADVAVNASFAEGMANAVLEALCAGRPILASDIPANRAAIGADTPDPAGLLFDPAQPSELAAQALRLVDDAALRGRLAEAARERALALPTADEEVAALAEAYRRVLGR